MAVSEIRLSPRAKAESPTLYKKGFSVFQKSIAIIIFLAIWEIAPRVGLINSQFVPPLSEVLRAIGKMAVTGELWLHTSASLMRAVEGFVLASLVGIPLGFLLGGWFRTVKSYFNPLLYVLAQVNPFSLFPIFILFFGIGETAKVAIIFWVAVFPVLFNTISGVANVDPMLVKAARAIGTPKVKLFWKVVLPGSAPMIFNGVRLAIGSAFLMLIAAEMVGASKGLGWLVLNSQINYQIPRLFAAAVVIAILGIVVTKLVEWMERKIIVWREAVSVD